ncbi:transposase [Streptomyces europaeiscabiei]|uniref:transposase n=1 Tax=Streptomyces europaeiscabiei TaxID=146819 RepID=UPI0038D446B5
MEARPAGLTIAQLIAATERTRAQVHTSLSQAEGPSRRRPCAPDPLPAPPTAAAAPPALSLTGPGDRGLPVRQRRGYDTNKHINEHKRHHVVDQDSLLFDLLVTPADVQDRDTARILLTSLHAEHPEIVLVWADNGYGGEEFSTWAEDTLDITIKVVPRPKDAKGFVLLPKRWVVERSNSWTMRARRNTPRRRAKAAWPRGTMPRTPKIAGSIRGRKSRLASAPPLSRAWSIGRSTSSPRGSSDLRQPRWPDR